MSEFGEWFSERMENIGYKLKGFPQVSDELIWYEFNDLSGNTRVDVLLITKALKPEDIRGLFENEDEPVLFVVDMKLIPSFIWENEKPEWIRILHAIYYGRVYVWNYGMIQALHFEWGTGKHNFSEAIDTSGILFDHTECKLKSFPGYFHIARFYDAAFWKQQQKPKGESWKERAEKQKSNFWKETFGFDSWDDYMKANPPKGTEWNERTKSYEHSNPNYSNKETDYEGMYEDIREAFNRYKQQYGGYNPYEDMKRRTRPEYYQPRPTGDKWFEMMIATGSLEAAKKKYRELANQYHPDKQLNSGEDTTEIMQAINNAFSKVKEYWT
jgi:hypothetical protein